MVLPSQQPPTLATGKSGKVGGALRDRPGLARALSRVLPATLALTAHYSFSSPALFRSAAVYRRSLD